MKNIFKRKYVGPLGPHLNCLTETSITGTYTEGKQRSVHSTRGDEYLSRGRGKNTSKARNPERKGKLALASKELDRRRRDREATRVYINSKSGVVWNEGMYKIPGSMNY